jgi:DivIVA domain-containing protein
MDVTPQELRGSEIKEAFRGYHRDEVDDLLERAAVTIEHLTRQLAEQPARRPAGAPSDVPPQVSRDDAETIQRTLLLAQRAADDAVAEAQTRAHQIVEESETKAQALVGDAEATARRIHEGERRRLEGEIAELTARRDRVRADADALEEYANGYRDRVRAAIEADLANLGSVIDAPSARPALQETDVPAFASAPTPDTFAASEDASTGALAAVSPERVSDLEPERTSEATPTVSASPLPVGSDWPPAPAAASAAATDAPQAWGLPEPPVADDTATSSEPFSSDVAMEAQPVDTEMLEDDDAFFASLRDAVRDDAPLGSLEGASGSFFDDAEPEPSTRRFRRR